MHIAVDETGSFREGKDLEYGLVTLVTITDAEWIKFQAFMDKSFPTGWHDLKGSKLDFVNRQKIINYIGKKNEIKYVSFVYDLNFGKDEYVEKHRHGQIQKIISSITPSSHPSMKKDIELMAKRLQRLSLAEYSKIILIYELYREWRKYFEFDFLHVSTKNDLWDMLHVIDSQNRAGNFIDLIDKFLILTTNHLSLDYRIFSPENFDGKDHPFYKKHCVDGDENKPIDGHKFYKYFKISNEQEEPVLFLPDVIGNTIHKSIKYRNEKRYLKLLKKLMSNRSLTLNNRFRQGLNNYYLVRGFMDNQTDYLPSDIFQEHHRMLFKL